MPFPFSALFDLSFFTLGSDNRYNSPAEAVAQPHLRMKAEEFGSGFIGAAEHVRERCLSEVGNPVWLMIKWF